MFVVYSLGLHDVECFRCRRVIVCVEVMYVVVSSFFNFYVPCRVRTAAARSCFFGFIWPRVSHTHTV